MKTADSHKWLLGAGCALLLLALVIKNVQMSEKATIITGAVEVFVAIAIGIAFGLAPGRRSE
jgi:hypothetical protein